MSMVKNYVIIRLRLILDRFTRSYNTLDDPSSRVCIPNETEGLNLYVVNMITGINKLKKINKAYILQM